MLPDSIGFDIAEMVKNAQQIMAATDALPPVSTVTQNEGPTDSASGDFRYELRWTAQQLGMEVLKISNELKSLEGAVKSYQESLTAHDDAAEGDLTQLIGFIDSAPTLPIKPGGAGASPNESAPAQSGTAPGVNGFE